MFLFFWYYSHKYYTVRNLFINSKYSRWVSLKCHNILQVIATLLISDLVPKVKDLRLANRSVRTSSGILGGGVRYYGIWYLTILGAVVNRNFMKKRRR